jgi:leucyl aminopeptidase
MGAFLAVAQGTRNEPIFIVLEHNAGRSDLPTIVLVGKGVTFDSGGLTLKARDGMVAMKSDMGGAAAVLGATQAIAELDLPVHLVAICPCVENMPDGAAYRPSDVIIASNGVSIEIHSTDAEGRLALADALVYAGRYAPDAVVDIATLTGASITALGEGVSSSLFASSEDVAARLAAASLASGERVWRMPLFEEYKDTIDAKVAADLKNSGGAKGGVGTSAVFLQAFTDYPWAHVDMAGMALVDAPRKKSYLTPGATGYGVRLLVDFVNGFS